MSSSLTFLGTGTSVGVPMIGCKCRVCLSKDYRDKRLRSSVILSINNKNILIDAGPDMRYQMLRADVSRIDAVLITHEHIDHIGGIDDLRAFNHFQSSPIEIYAANHTCDVIKRIYFYAFSDNPYPGAPVLNLHEINDERFYIDDIEIQPIRVNHYRIDAFGYRFGNFAYITDAKTIPDDSIEKLRGVKYLVINALRIEPHISHLCLDEALSIIEKLHVKKAYLTHICHQFGRYQDVAPKLPNNVFIAYDTETLVFD